MDTIPRGFAENGVIGDNTALVREWQLWAIQSGLACSEKYGGSSDGYNNGYKE